MDLEEKKAKLEAMQKYFTTSFWISFIVLFIASVLCMVFRDSQIAIMEKYFQIGAKAWGFIVVLTLAMWKILIIQFTLIPALAIWCIRKCCKCNCKKED